MHEISKIAYSVEINLRPQFWVVFNLGLEHLQIFVFSNLAFLLFFVNVVFIFVLFLQMLQFPHSLSLSFSELRECLLDQNDLRNYSIHVFHLIEFHHVHGIQVISKHCVIVTQNLAQVSVHDEGLIILAEIGLSGDFDLDHLKSLLSCCSAHIDIVVCVLNVEDYELGQSVSAAESSELVLPVHLLVDLVCLHSENINDVDES